MSALGRLFESTRKRLGLTRGEVVRRAGWKNVGKGANKLVRIERGDDVFPRKGLLERFAPALGLSEEDLLQAMSEDFERLDRPVPPQVIVRIMAAVYIPLKLPDGCTVDEAVEIATRHAVEEKRRAWVVLSELRSIGIRPDGTSYESYSLPHSTLGGLPGPLLPAHFRSKEGLNIARGVAGTEIEKGKGEDKPGA